MSKAGRKVRRLPEVALANYHGKSLVIRRPAGL